MRADPRADAGQVVGIAHRPLGAERCEVTVVGSTPGLAARVGSTLTGLGLDVPLDERPDAVACTVPETEAARAVVALHTALELDAR